MTTRCTVVAGICMSLIAACTVNLPPTPTVVPTDTPIATATPAPVACETHTASVVLSASAETLRVGEVLRVTVTLRNDGCIGLGLPQYRLSNRSDGAEAILAPSDPEPVVHSLAVAPGQSDAVEYGLTAVASGQATLTAVASFEVHIGYPGPAYWGNSSGAPLVITVAP